MRRSALVFVVLLSVPLSGAVCLDLFLPGDAGPDASVPLVCDGSEGSASAAPR